MAEDWLAEQWVETEPVVLASFYSQWCRNHAQLAAPRFCMSDSAIQFARAGWLIQYLCTLTVCPRKRWPMHNIIRCTHIQMRILRSYCYSITMMIEINQIISIRCKLHLIEVFNSKHSKMCRSPATISLTLDVDGSINGFGGSTARILCINTMVELVNAICYCIFMNVLLDQHNGLVYKH